MVDRIPSTCRGGYIQYRTFEYQELKIDCDRSESSVPIAPKESKQIDPGGNTSVTSVGFQSSKKSGSRISKGTSSSSRACARAVAREVDLPKLRVEQVKEKVKLEAKIAAQKADSLHNWQSRKQNKKLLGKRKRHYF